MFQKLFILTLCIAPFAAQAALTEEQREDDLKALASIYAKRYAPANWKIAALGVNVFDLREWMPQARAAQNDLEYIEVLMRYVASFQDGHATLTMPSSFQARLGFTLDLYDGKPVIELVDRRLLPAAQYPFGVGDEVVSIDGVPVLEAARRLQPLRGWGNPVASLRYNVGLVASVAQSVVPTSVNLPDESTVVVRRLNGEVETYQIPWTKTGTPIREIGGVPSPFFGLKSGVRFSEGFVPSNNEDPDQVPTWRRMFFERHMASVAEEMMRPAMESFESEEGVRYEPKALLNWGSRFPWFALPQGFRLRLGGAANDVFFSGVYNFDGFRMGYLRVPNFPVYTAAQYEQLDREIDFFNQNTDGLIVDVARNTGGSVCSVVDLAARLIPNQLTYTGLAFRPNLARIVAYDNQISQLQSIGAPNWAIEILQFERKQLNDAYVDGRGITGPQFVCSFDQPIAAAPNAYAKPMIVLVDEFSFSGGDMFPSVIQDNGRAKLVGMRTAGAGGSVENTPAGAYAETNTRVTASLMVRNADRDVEGFPRSPFIENVGVRPDVELNYMTVENAVNQGRPYSEAFSRILAEEIRRQQP
ncbi:MAG: S41 family peptidase [Bryobacter sp.]|nr:S41 family peptidase [Bryobacter sp.]